MTQSGDRFIRKRLVDELLARGNLDPAAVGPPLLEVSVRNRGRRAAQIRTLARTYWLKVAMDVYDEAFETLPATLEAGHSMSIMIGRTNPYAIENFGLFSRFYITEILEAKG